jgi:hypothetical protein
LWKEVRMQRPAHLQGDLQPKAPRMETAPDHFAVGLTAREGTAFQGRHEKSVLIVFDECVGVSGEFWDSAEGMMTGESCFWLAICNPTDTSSRAYQECQNTDKWHVVSMSAMEHPNIAAELAGEPAPFPKAVRLQWIEERVREWCTEEVAGGQGSGVGDWQDYGGGEARTHTTNGTDSGSSSGGEEDSYAEWVREEAERVARLGRAGREREG